MTGSSQARMALTAGAALAAAAAGYSLVLLAAARRRSSPPAIPPLDALPELAALVPAHNEEDQIVATIASLRAVDYPTERWRPVVVADNCTDRTAELAREAGAEVIERVDRERRGKPHALAHGFEALLGGDRPPAAIVVVDADCEVSPNLPAAVASRLAAGARAVQTGNVVSNPCDSTYSALRFAAFTAINGTRPRGRDELGFSAGLLGTGMAFSSDLLRERPWDAFGLAEDQEFHLSLVAAGDRVAFAAEARVASKMPTSFGEATEQQRRWSGGRGAMLRRWAPPLLVSAARRRLAPRSPTWRCRRWRSSSPRPGSSPPPRLSSAPELPAGLPSARSPPRPCTWSDPCATQTHPSASTELWPMCRYWSGGSCEWSSRICDLSRRSGRGLVARRCRMPRIEPIARNLRYIAL